MPEPDCKSNEEWTLRFHKFSNEWSREKVFETACGIFIFERGGRKTPPSFKVSGAHPGGERKKGEKEGSSFEAAIALRYRGRKGG